MIEEWGAIVTDWMIIVMVGVFVAYGLLIMIGPARWAPWNRERKSPRKPAPEPHTGRKSRR